MVFHRGLNDSKSPQISRTLLSVLADLNNIEVCMISSNPLIFKSSSPCTSPLVTGWIIIGITVTFMCHSFFQFPSKVQVLTFLFTFFSASSHFFFFFVDYYSVRSPGRDLVIRLYLKIPEELVRLVLRYSFCVVRILSVY